MHETHETEREKKRRNISVHIERNPRPLNEWLMITILILNKEKTSLNDGFIKIPLHKNVYGLNHALDLLSSIK